MLTAPVRPQIWLAGLLQEQVGAGLIVGAALTVTVVGARALGRLSPESRLWTAWQAGGAVVGLCVLPQVLYSSFLLSGAPPLAHALIPGALGGSVGVVLLVLDAAGGLPPPLRGCWSALSAWIATLLFCTQPVAQLAANLVDPASVAGLSLGTVLLAMVGNAMMAPRALFTRDVIWATGTLWGSLAMGWGNLLCMALATSTAGCAARSRVLVVNCALPGLDDALLGGACFLLAGLPTCG